MHAMAILLLQIDCAIVEWSVVVQLVTYHLLSTEELQANWVEQLDDKVVLLSSDDWLLLRYRQSLFLC